MGVMVVHTVMRASIIRMLTLTAITTGNKMLAIYPLLVLNRFCKFEFVTSSNKRNEMTERTTKPIVGYVLKVLSTNPFCQEFRLLPRHQDVAPVWAFSISACRDCGDTKLESADAEKRQADLNNRELLPRSGRLTDYTSLECKGVTRSQHSNRIEQPVMRNVVCTSLVAKNTNDIKGRLKAWLKGFYHPCIVIFERNENKNMKFIRAYIRYRNCGLSFIQSIKCARWV
jgi:hypothetical protein